MISVGVRGVCNSVCEACSFQAVCPKSSEFLVYRLAPRRRREYLQIEISNFVFSLFQNEERVFEECATMGVKPVHSKQKVPKVLSLVLRSPQDVIGNTNRLKLAALFFFFYSRIKKDSPVLIQLTTLITKQYLLCKGANSCTVIVQWPLSSWVFEECATMGVKPVHSKQKIPKVQSLVLRSPQDVIGKTFRLKLAAL
ncbi:uncharacterized protein [Palaemon carinicauda]|uniref:uncharacterized protein n=1 Tax=Palaemon carinicauda TaxID=392227 RepID=UPI0035B6A059